MYLDFIRKLKKNIFLDQDKINKIETITKTYLLKVC